MAKIKILKEGETDIDSTDIWRFALHSDYKCQKLSSTSSKILTMPALSGSASTTISHGLGYKPAFYLYVEHDNKGYETVGNLNPSIFIKAANFFAVNFSYTAILNRSAELESSDSLINHGITGQEAIQVKKNPSNSSLPANMSEGQTFYRHSDSTSTILYLSTTAGGSKQTFGTSPGTRNNYWGKSNDFLSSSLHKVEVLFNVNVDSTKLNVQALVSDLFGRKNFDEEEFTLRVFFIADEIV